MSITSQEATASAIGRRIYVASVLALVALVLLRDHFVYGYPFGDSTQFNVPWSVAFSDQFWSGDLYPRWLYSFPQNLGSPVFYFYGPLPFYLLALIKGLVPGISPSGSLTILHGLLYWASGFAFYIWSRQQVSGGLALVGACLYMGAPYHLLDLEHRNAIGEAMAFIFVPLIFRYLLDIDGRGGRWLLAGLSYAALIVSHLPSALLVAPFMVLAVGVIYRRALPHGLWRVAVTGIGGALLSGPYLFPALLLRDWLPSDAWLSGPTSWPESWLLPQGFFFRSGGLVYGAILSTMAFAILLQSLVWWKTAREQNGGSQEPVALLSLLGLGIAAVLFSPLSLWLWVHVGPLRNVQFPFRLGVVTDFLSITLAVCAIHRLVTPAASMARGIWVVATIGFLFIMATGMMAFTDLGRVFVGRWPAVDERPYTCCTQAPEYWMTSVLRSRLYARLQTPEAFQAAASDFAPLHSQRALDPGESLDMKQIAGELRIEARLSRATDVRIAQAFFPGWELVADDIEKPLILAPDPETGLLMAELPAGTHLFRLYIPETDPEIRGKYAGLGGLILMGTIAWMSRRRSFTAAGEARSGS